MQRTPQPRRSSRSYRWIQWARERHLRGAAQPVLVIIATHCDRDGHCFLTYGTLAIEAGVSKVTAIKAVRSLEADGYVTATASRGRKSREYSLTGAVQPSLFDAPVAETPVTARAAREPSQTPTDAKAEIRAFLKARKRQDEIAAIVRAGTAAGLAFKGDHVAGICKRYDKTTIARAVEWMADPEHPNPVGDPTDYLERMIRNANNGRKPARRQSSEPVDRGDDTRGGWA